MKSVTSCIEAVLQFFAITLYSITFQFGGVTCTIFLTLVFLFTPYYWLVVLYITWEIIDINTCHFGGRKIISVRRLKLWEYLRDYFPVSLVKTVDLDPKKNYIFGSHPHGILCCGAFVNFGTESTSFSEMFPGLNPHLLTLTGQFWWPLYREFVLSSGGCSVSKESFRWILNFQGMGNVAVVVVGGAVEALDGTCGRLVLTLKRRKGFITMALESGSDLVPTFSFGETDVYEDYLSNRPGTLVRWLQEKLIRVFGYPLVLVRGRGFLQNSYGFVPRRGKIVTVIGKPIPVIKNPYPSKEDVDELHQRYMNALKHLYDEYKTQFGHEHVEMEIV